MAARAGGAAYALQRLRVATGQEDAAARGVGKLPGITLRLFRSKNLITAYFCMYIKGRVMGLGDRVGQTAH